jgi:hypothetical protein
MDDKNENSGAPDAGPPEPAAAQAPAKAGRRAVQPAEQPAMQAITAAIKCLAKLQAGPTADTPRARAIAKLQAAAGLLEGTVQ